MTRISSSWTFLAKRVFPTFWFDFLALFVFVGFSTGTVAKDVTFLIIPIVMAVFGFFIMRKLVWDLADEVYDCARSRSHPSPAFASILSLRTKWLRILFSVSIKHDRSARSNKRLKLAGRSLQRNRSGCAPDGARTVVYHSCAGGRVARSLSAIR